MRPSKPKSRGSRPAGKPASQPPRARSPHPRARPAGFEARQVAVETLWLVMHRGRFLEEALVEALSPPGRAALDARDRAFARLVVTTVLRRHGELGALIHAHLEKPLPEKRGRLSEILLAAAAQLLLLGTPAHAAIGLAVEQCKADGITQRFAKLANAVLRRVAVGGTAALDALDRVTLNMPAWLMERWQQTYGQELARRIAVASLEEPPLDLTVKANPEEWAARLAGVMLPSGTVRIAHAGRVTELDGFTEGAWWVQDAAAALPARLLHPRPGMHVADLCAAPGGKTAQLAAAGAGVTAVDVSPKRLQRVEENLARLGLKATLVAADATTWAPDQRFDAVLLDAPCTATGTIRRHPDILHVRQQRGFEKMLGLQTHLLTNAATLLRPGGTLVYCTCSLEIEEGENQISTFLASNPEFAREPIAPDEIGGLAEAVTAVGDLRTLPCHRFPGADVGAGLDGFFATRLRRAAS